MTSPSADLRAALTGVDGPERPRSRFRSLIWPVAGWLVFAVVATAGAALHLESEVGARVAQAVPGVEVAVDGRDVTILGAVSAGATDDIGSIPGVRSVTERPVPVASPPPVASAPPIERPVATTLAVDPAVPHLVADLRDGVLTLRGSISEEALAAITPVAELIYAPNLMVEVDTDVDPAPWEALVGSLISVLPITGDAELVVLDSEVRLVGIALDERRRAQLIGAAASILGDSMSLDADVAVTGLRAPSFAAVASIDGSIVLEGEVPDAEIAATIVAFAADAYGTENVTDNIAVSSEVARTFSPFRVPYIFHSLRAIPEWNITIEDDAISGNLRGGATFGVASARLTPELESLLDIAAGILLRNPSVGAIIEGHTDSRGRADDNLRLSEDRALAAARYLVARGVAQERLIALGYGETSPIADNSTPEGRAENRRIEFTLAPVQQ